MFAWLDGMHVLVLLAVGVAGSAVRSQMTYWLGRGIARGVESRWQDALTRPAMRRATEAIQRRGMPVVPLSFGTVGFQTAVNAAAGVLRIPWLTYTLWAVPGWFLWSAIWMGGGLAAVLGGAALAAQSPWVLAVVVLAGAVGALALVRRRRQRGALASPGSAGPASADPDLTVAAPAASTAPPKRRSRRA